MSESDQSRRQGKGSALDDRQSWYDPRANELESKGSRSQAADTVTRGGPDMGRQGKLHYDRDQ